MNGIDDLTLCDSPVNIVAHIVRDHAGAQHGDQYDEHRREPALRGPKAFLGERNDPRRKQRRGRQDKYIE